MPKFLYTVLLLSVALWFFTGRMFLSTRPNTISVILWFLVLFGSALTFTISVPAYLILAKKSPNFTNLRFLYRKAFKWGFFIGSLVSIFLGLRAFGLASTFNLIMLAIAYAMIFLQFRRSR